MNLFQLYQTNSTWYRGANTNSTPVGILWHDTAAGNPKISRYMQPLKTDSNYDEMIKIIGVNKYKNDFNNTAYDKGVNAFIGKLADGTIGIAQMGEWEKTPWGCGKGTLGSCNGYEVIGDNVAWKDIHWIQFEICDDGYSNKEYFEAVFEEGCQLTAYLCKKFNIDPFGTVKFCGIDVPTILCHKDAYKLKLGSNHSDTLTWFKKFGKTMDDVRNRVQEIMLGEAKEQSEDYIITGNVNLRAGPSVDTKILTTLIKGTKVTVIKKDGNWGLTTYLNKTGWFGLKYAEKVKNEIPSYPAPDPEKNTEDATEKTPTIEQQEKVEDNIKVEQEIAPTEENIEAAQPNEDISEPKEDTSNNIFKKIIQKIIDFLKNLLK